MKLVCWEIVSNKHGVSFIIKEDRKKKKKECANSMRDSYQQI